MNVRWTRVAVLCVMGLSLSCAGSVVEFIDGAVKADGVVIDDLSLEDGQVIDGMAPDLQPGVIDELTEGRVSTIGGPASATIDTFEGKPTYELEADGLEYAGIHGALCSADNDLCITEGGIDP